MAIKLVADLHGSFRDLPDRIGEHDVLLVLGDVLDLIDWADFSGILPDVLGRENLVQRLFAAFAAGPGAARELREELFSPDGDYYRELVRRTREQYRDFSGVLKEIGCRAYIIYGNSDIPDMLEEALEGVEKAALIEGRVNIEDEVFGFVPGAIYSPFQMPGEMDEEEFGERLRELGRVDVICTHIPPHFEKATYDVVAERPVEGSKNLLSYIERERPGYLYHGHVHHPAQRALRIGDTVVLNAAYYKRDRYIHEHGEDDGI